MQEEPRGGAKEYRVDRRDWSDRGARLDLDERPELFRLWKVNAKPFLTSGPLQLCQVLDWVARQVEPITAKRQLEAGSMLWGHDIPAVSASLYTAVRWAISDRLRMTSPPAGRRRPGVRALEDPHP